MPLSPHSWQLFSTLDTADLGGSRLTVGRLRDTPLSLFTVLMKFKNIFICLFFQAETLGYGPVAPFVVAIIPLVVCGVIVTR